MAFDIQPPARKKTVSKPPARSKAPVVSKSDRSASSKQVAAPKKIAKPQPKKVIIPKTKKVSKAGVVISWLALLLALGFIGYIVWQEEMKNKGLLQADDGPAGIIQTFPQNDSDATSPSSQETENLNRGFSQAEEKFSQDWENLNNQDLVPPDFDLSGWSEINNYLDNF